MVHLLAAPLQPLTAHLSILLAPDVGAAIADQVKPFVKQAITVLQVLFPLIAVFRIVYRFAETKEGSVIIIVAEVVIIVFLSFAIGFLVQNMIDKLIP
jgi:hypothetical protein